MEAVPHAVILVGGRGTRLGDLARDVPKPMVEIAPGWRFLDLLLAWLVQNGITDVLLLAGHLGEVVAERYDGARIGPATVSVLREPSPAGTGGALLVARERLAERFFLLNGDSLFDFDVQALQAALRPQDAAALALRRVDDPARYGAVALEAGRILRFEEKRADLTGPALINGGVYLARRAILDDIPPPPSSIESDAFPKLAREGRLGGAAFEGYFLDIGLPDTLARARAELPHRYFGLRPA